MPRRIHLPPHQFTDAFAVADALNGGLAEGRLRGADLERPFHGVRRLPLESTDRSEFEVFVERCRDFSPLLRDDRFFSHTTAARLWDAPLPVQTLASDFPHVSVMTPRQPPRGRGVRGHELFDENTTVTVRRDLPVTDAATTWLNCAGLLPIEELVALGDHLILAPHVVDPADIRPWVSRDELALRLQRFRGKGKSRATRALAMVRQGAESRPETLLRLLLVRSGLPEPEVNRDVHDSTGRFIGRADLLYPKWRTIVEYDGEQHRTSSTQYARDVVRVEQFHAAKWNRVGVRKDDLFRAASRTVDRVSRALRDHGWPG